MNKARIEQTRRRMTSPRSAGFAGILFAILYGTAIVLIRLSLPENALEAQTWLGGKSQYIAYALSLVPFSGMAFLYFIGVVRDRVGESEDRLFSTVFLGSGLLYLGMVFVAAALAGGLLTSMSIDPLFINDHAFMFGNNVMRQITNIYSLRMAAVFMTSFATIFLRTGAMPRWTAIITYILALVLLLSVSLSPWLSLAFPAWVFVMSLFILITNYRRHHEHAAVAADAG
jgi:hypothetical protein